MSEPAGTPHFTFAQRPGAPASPRPPARKGGHMATTTEAPSMLEQGGERIPTEDELNAALEEFSSALEKLEWLGMALHRAVNDPDGLPMTAERAWHLFDYAEGVELYGRAMIKEVRTIRETVPTLYTERSEA